MTAQAHGARGARGGGAWRRFRRHRLALVAAAALALAALVALLAGTLAPYPPSEQFLHSGGAALDPLAARASGKFEAPSAAHLLGTDQLARDILSRTLLALRISLLAAAVAVIAVTAIGVTVGLVAASGPRWLDDLLMRATDVAYAFPELLLAILLRAALGERGTLLGMHSLLGVEASAWLLFAAIALSGWPTMARLMRGQLLALREREFTTAAVALGASRRRIALRHWLPNAAGPVIVEAAFVAPRAIFAEATLSFIGIGVTPPTPSLGVLIADHFGFVTLQWTALAVPVALLALLFLAFQLLGDGLLAVLDPRAAR